MKILPLAIALLLAAPALAAPVKKAAPVETKTVESHDSPKLEITTVTLQGLNKVTGKISRLEGPVGTLMRFGNLEIVARRCWKSPPEDRPENAALLDISELKPGEAPQRIFLGWMFSSSPGLSGLEHPVYDITVLSCDMSEEAEPAEKPAPAPKADQAPKKPAAPAKAKQPKAVAR